MRPVRNSNHLIRYLTLAFGLLLAAWAPQQLQATHIVGGEMGYRIINTTDTEVTVEIVLSVYRDCFFGNPEVYFDEPAFIGVFDDRNFRVRQLDVNFQGQDDTLTNQLDTFCLVNLDPVCVHTTTYRTTVTLPRTGGGYTFAYQRCCRNETVANIIDPLDVGATYTIRLSPEAIERGNDSPVFKNWPPIYICAGQPLLFDHSAIDEDGDSLVYTLCHPFAGADMDDPKPFPTPNPPYDSIPWADGFSVDNMLGVGDPLRINDETGVMTAVPGARGQYVVGVCVDEYDRNTGELLSRTRRDFQYNVNPCDDLTAEWTAENPQCEGLTVTFANTSTAPEDPSFKWFFDWPNPEPSLEVDGKDSVTFTFPAQGSYTVALIAEPGAICADTFMQVISVSDSVVADFTFSGECEGLTLAFDNNSENATAYAWDFGDGNTSNEENPTHTYDSPGTYTVRLRAFNETTCDDTIEVDITVSDQPVSVAIGAEIDCRTDLVEVAFESAVVNPFGGDVSYEWTFSDGTPSTSNVANPVVEVTGDATLIATLDITTENGCMASAADTIEIEFTEFNFPDTVIFCENQGPFLNPEGGKDGFEYRWSPGQRLFPDSTVANPKARPEQDTWYFVTVTPTDGSACTFVDSVFVQVPQPINIDIGPQLKTICGEPITITAKADVDLDALTIEYFSSINGPIGSGSSITYEAGSPIDTVIVIATDTFGCMDRDRMIITNNSLDIDLDKENITLCVGESDTVSVINNKPTDVLTYSWNSALIQGATNQESVVIQGLMEGTFVVEVAVENQFGCMEILTVNVTVNDINAPDLPDVLTVCPGESVALNPGATDGSGLTYQWSPTTELNLTNPANPVASPTQNRTYFVTITDADGCSAKDSVEVRVSEPLNLQIQPGDTTLCEPEPLMLRATGNGLDSIQWFDAEPLTSPLPQMGPMIIVNPQSGATTYFAVATNEFGCRDTASVTITISDFPPGTLPDTIVSCTGEDIDLNPDDIAGVTFTFSPSTGIDNSDPLNPTVTLMDDQTYFVTLTDVASGCTREDTMTVIVPEELTIEIEPGDTTLCENQSLTLTATTNRDALIRWFAAEPFVDTLRALDGLITLDSLNVTFSAGTNTIFAVAEDPESGCLDTAMITVLVTDLDVDDIPDETVCGNESVVLNEGGNASFDYQWSPATGLNSDTLASPTATLTMDQTYFVTITERLTGCTKLDTVVVDVTENLELEVTPGDSVFCEPVDLTLTATTAIPTTVIWYLGTSATGMALDTSLTLPVSLGVGTTSYTALAESESGCTDTVTVTYTVSETPEAPDGDTLCICSGESVALNPGGNPTFIYQWSPDADLDLSDPSNPVARPTSNQTYMVTVTDPTGTCSAEGEVTVEVSDPLDLTLVPGDTTYCTDTLVTLTVSSDQTFNAVWFAGSTGTDPIQVDNNTMEADLIVDLEVGANTFIVVGTTGAKGCADTVSTTLTLSNMIDGLPPPTVPFCPDDEMRKLNPQGSSEFTYEWSPQEGLDDPNSPNPTFTLDASRTYTVTVTDPESGCEAMVTVTALVQPEIGLQAGDDILFCDPDTTLTLTSTVLAGGVTYEWRQGTAPIEDSNTDSIQVSPPNGNTQYIVMATDAAGCMEEDTVMVNNRPVLASIPPIGPFCAPDELGLKEIRVVSATGDSLTVLWDSLGVVGDLDMPMAMVDLNVANTFSAMVTNDFGCMAEVSTTIDVINLTEQLSGTIAPNDTIFLGEEFTLSVLGCDDCNYTWTLPDGGQLEDAGPEIVHEPVTGGDKEYRVEVSQTVSQNPDKVCAADVTIRGFVSLVICDETRVFLPTAFTPNGDGINDVLEIRSNFRDQLVINDFVVYNRWGEIVFETDDPSEGWDGTFQNNGGDVLPPDVFTVILNVTCPGGETLAIDQQVALIR